MRKIFLLSAGLVLALILGGVLLLPRSAPPPAAGASVSAAVAPATPEPAAPAAPPSAAPPVADLPSIEVPQRPVHAVPDEAPAPPRPVTIRDRDGREIASPARPQAASPAAPAPDPRPRLIGAGRAVDGVSLAVRGERVQLFGVQPPRPGDRCTMSPQAAARACGEVALAARLGANANVSCRVPPGQRATPPAAICLDSTGTDLGGFLVAEGFALADRTQSYDYVGAEGVARAFRRGLWHYR
jgi:endonuclease YncB( thermonuclease family)